MNHEKELLYNYHSTSYSRRIQDFTDANEIILFASKRNFKPFERFTILIINDYDVTDSGLTDFSSA